MTTLEDVTKKSAGQSAEAQAAVELVRLAKEQGLSLTGPDGLLKQLTKTVLETALSEEMTERLGYEKHDPAGAGTGNIRNGTRGKTVLRPFGHGGGLSAVPSRTAGLGVTVLSRVCGATRTKGLVWGSKSAGTTGRDGYRA